MPKFWAKKAFSKHRHTGWKKSQSATTRRRHLLKKHRGNARKAALSALAVANLTQDRATRVKARADYKALFAKWKRRGKRR